LDCTQKAEQRGILRDSWCNPRWVGRIPNRVLTKDAPRVNILSMKTYIVYVDGEETGTIKAGSHNAAERKAQKRYPNKNVSVAYTEV
jgi:hypothetical protein